MAIKQQVSALLDKKMNREDFLKHVAIGMVAMSGLGAVLRFAQQPDKQLPRPSSQSVGYGGSVYGGVKKS